jgi:integrase
VATIRRVGDHGQGTITRRADGRLQVAVTMIDGQRAYRYVPKMLDRKRQRRLAEKERAKLVEARERELDPSSQMLGDYLRSWIGGLRNATRRRPRPRTLEHYSHIIEAKVIPSLGEVRLDRLTPRHVQAWLDGIEESPRSVHHYRAVLRRALNVAQRQQVIAYNPALQVEMPELVEFSGSPLTAAEARALFAATASARLGVLWRLALDTGLRESELLGLAWEDVDLMGGTIKVAHQLWRSAGAWQLVAPKTGTKRETIHLMPSTVTALREHQRRMAQERTPAWRYFGLVFVTPAGEPFGRAVVLRAFHAACDAAGISRRRVHDLRGSTATILQDEGIPEAVRMARLGHATTKMARHYAQVRDDLDREAAMALERVLG